MNTMPITYLCDHTEVTLVRGSNAFLAYDVEELARWYICSECAIERLQAEDGDENGECDHDVGVMMERSEDMYVVRASGLRELIAPDAYETVGPLRHDQAGFFGFHYCPKCGVELDWAALRVACREQLEETDDV